MRDRSKLLLGIAAIVALTWAVYTPSIGHDFVMDDSTYIGENPAVTAGAPLSAYFLDSDTTAHRSDFRWQSYRPVRTVGFRVLVAAFGVRPAAFGIANLILYGLAIALVAELALALCGDRAAALAATALWALLPVHVEPVVYASALGDHLSLVLQLLALAAAARAVTAERGALVYALASLATAWLAMGAKEMAITEGGLLALGAACRWPLLTATQRRRAVALVAAHGALTLGFLMLRTHVIGAVGQGAITSLTAQVAARAVPIYLWKYVQVIAAPLGHSAAYASVPLKRGPALLAWLGVLAVAGALWRLRRPGLRFAFGWYALSLLPVLHVVPLLAYYADRFAFVPSIGLALALALALAETRGRARRLALAATLLLAAVYAAGVLVEERAWRSDATLWRFAVDAQPNAALAQSNLAIELLHEGAPAEALAHLEAARRLNGGGLFTQMQLAVAYDMLGRDADTESTLRALMRESTALPESHALLASVLVRRGQLDEAGREVAAALAMAPELPSAWMARGVLAEARGQLDVALDSYRRAAALSPEVARYHLRYGQAALRAGDRNTATIEARACLQRQPDRPDCQELLARATAP